jgi:CBS domain containing-hemolysin-like protein
LNRLTDIAEALGAGWRALTDALADPARAARRRHASADDTAATEDAEAMIEAVGDLGEKVVREVMVPRTDIVCLEDTASIDDAIATITAAGVSRVPVYHDDLDDIRGVLYAKDLLRCVSDTGVSRLVSDHMREALFVPETKPVGELLREMRRRTHIAIVLDEYGGTAGLVTIEDLVEEIVGEIYDEYDEEVQLVTDIGDGRYSVDGRLPIDDLAALLGVSLDEIDADTAAGVVSELAGRIPEVGESVSTAGVRMTVAVREGNRIRQVTTQPAPRDSDEEEQA